MRLPLHFLCCPHFFCAQLCWVTKGCTACNLKVSIAFFRLSKTLVCPLSSVFLDFFFCDFPSFLHFAAPYGNSLECVRVCVFFRVQPLCVCVVLRALLADAAAAATAAADAAATVYPCCPGKGSR